MKHFLILIAIFSLMACSSDDDSSSSNEISQNLLGKWYNGTIGGLLICTNDSLYEVEFTYNKGNNSSNSEFLTHDF